MATQDLLEYVYDRVIERLVECVPGATEEGESAWFDQMIEDWIRAQQPGGVDDVDEDLCEAGIEYRTPEGKPLRKLNVEFRGAAQERDEDVANVPDYSPPPIRDSRDTGLVQLWMQAAYQPWPDLPLERAAEVLSRRIGYSAPQPPLTHESACLDWVHFSVAEARALAFELYQAGVDIETLLAQIEAFPYDDISLAWLTEPEKCIHLHTTLVEQMAEEEREMHPESLARLRHTAEFVYRVAALIPAHVRIWLRGWSAAFIHTAFARAVGLALPE